MKIGSHFVPMEVNQQYACSMLLSNADYSYTIVYTYSMLAQRKAAQLPLIMSWWHYGVALLANLLNTSTGERPSNCCNNS